MHTIEARGPEFLQGPAEAPNLAALFLKQAARKGDQPFLRARRDGDWRWRSWRQAEVEVRALSMGLKALGIRPGDRVAVISENRPEWILVDLAILAAGGVTVPAYVTNTVEDHRHVLGNAGVRAAVVSGPALLDLILAASPPTLNLLVQMDFPQRATAGGPTPPVHLLEDVIVRGQRLVDDVTETVARVGRQDVACILHTSGAGGLPRGVVLTHDAILANLDGACRLLLALGLSEHEVFLSVLPISHAYEHTAGQLLPIAIGAEIWYADNPGSVSAALVDARPTILIVVPRVCDMLRQRILAEMRRSGPLRRFLFEATLRLGERRLAPGGLSLPESAVDALLGRMIRRKVRTRLGGRLKALVSGGAPLALETGTFFAALRVPILQGYGLTEASPVVSCNPPGHARVDTVGTALHGVEIRTAADGEILVRGPSVMQGYCGDPEASKEAIRDGWLYTGDVGEITVDGHLRITDRKRDFIKNSGGEMLSPLKIETALTSEPEIAQAMAAGDGRPYPVALLVPAAELMADRPDGDWEQAEAALRPLLARAVERANARLALPERVRRFLVVREPWTIGNGLLTPTYKLKRPALRERYGAAIDALYDGNGTASGEQKGRSGR